MSGLGNLNEKQMPGCSLTIVVLVLVLAMISLSQMTGRVAREIHEKAPAPVVSPPTQPTPPLPDSENRVVEVFKHVAPSVVSVANKALVSDFWGLRVFEVPQGVGSGFVWDKEGHIVSNFHVVEGASALQVTLKDGTSFEARLVGVSPDHDLAVLGIKAPQEKLVPIPLGTSADLEVGQRVLAIGNPFGLDCTLTMGIVSSLGRTMRSMAGTTIHDVIQTDAAINSGNSGGPLLDSSGRLVGINSAIVSPSGGSVGLGFAIPVDTAREIVPQLIAYGKPRQVGLGASFIPDHVARQYGIAGAAIRAIIQGSPAERAGLCGTTQDQLGDIVVAVDGQRIASLLDLRDVLLRHKDGDTVEIVYLRDGAEHKQQVTLQVME